MFTGWHDRYEGQEEDEETAAANAASSTSAGKNNELTVDAGRLDTDASSKSSTLERSKLKLDLATGRWIVEPNATQTEAQFGDKKIAWIIYIWFN